MGVSVGSGRRFCNGNFKDGEVKHNGWVEAIDLLMWVITHLQTIIGVDVSWFHCTK